MDDSVFPTPDFKLIFDLTYRKFNLSNEAGRRILINLFLTDVLRVGDVNDTLFVFLDQELSALDQGTESMGLIGTANFALGLSAPTRSHLDRVWSPDLFVVVIDGF